MTHRSHRSRCFWPRLTTALAALTLWAAPAAAFDFAGSKSVLAVTADGQRTLIGTVQFSPADGGAARFVLTLKTAAFTDHFLSMREFKCLTAAQEVSCYVPYPYANPARVSAGDLAWLEHSLLFLHKNPADFGAKLWNGVYYQLRDQGNALVGTPQAIDLNEISAPPDHPAVPPFGPAQRSELPADARWIRALVIE